ncbi:MAG: TatD family hydrolase [Candidatus Omnitrophica bacterium]|nr:TatD family hydrolase [Candidatus Omnitrophota bacterium]
MAFVRFFKFIEVKMFIDTHCHLDFDDYDKDRNDVIKDAINEKVRIIIDPGIDFDSSKRAIEVAKIYDCVYATIGIHPHNASKTDATKFNECMKLIENNKKVVGIGETGLDFYYQNSDRISQVTLFQKHIQFAREFDLPVVIHQRNAEKEMVEILENTKRPSKIVFHCFGGDEEFFQWVNENSFYVSFTGIITFSNAISVKKIAEKVRLDRVFFETDAPYLAPSPFRGKRNEPRFVRFVVEEFARIRKISVNEAASITTENAMKFFNLVY